MDRSQEKGISSQAKLQPLDQSANIHPKLHESQTVINRTVQRKISGDHIVDTLPYVEGRSGSDCLNNRKPEQLISPLQAPYYTLGNSGVGMGLPSYLPVQAMDHRGFGSLFYRPQPSIPMFQSGYTGTYSQRLPTDIRDTSGSSKSSDRSDSGMESKEPVRTESVIKIVTERTDSRKPDSVDKRLSRSSNDDYIRTYQEHNGDHLPYRVSRDKLDATSNGDARHFGNMERTLNDLRSYHPSSVNNKGLIPGSYVKDYACEKSDYQRVNSSQSSMFSSMPKLTPIAPRGHPSSPFSALSSATDGLSRSSNNGTPVRPTSTVYHPPRESITSEGGVSQRGDIRPEDDAPRANYLNRSGYENLPGYWERGDVVAPRYPGHSAYQGYSYGRTVHTKRPEGKESPKQLDNTRSNHLAMDSLKESSISPDRTMHCSKNAIKPPSENSIHGKELVNSKTYIPAVSSQNDQTQKNHVTLSKSEKPVLPDNSRYRVSEEIKKVSKSDKVKVIKQGMAYSVSFRQTPSSYYANGGRSCESVESVDRTRPQCGYEPAVNKKEDKQRLGSNDKACDHGNKTGRTLELNTNERGNVSAYDDSKKPNDRNNNSSTNSYSRYQNHSERSRSSNKISLGLDKVFVPPNVTLEQFEKREKEMASCRSSDAFRFSELCPMNKTKMPGKKDGEGNSRYQSSDQTNGKQSSSKQETTIKSSSSSKGSDDEELKIIDERVSSQPHSARHEEVKRTSSPSRISRITSPNVSTAVNNPPYLTPFGLNFPVRRTPSESELVARENVERIQAAYLYGGGMAPFPANAAQFMTSGGRGDVPFMLPMEMLYGGLYKPPMMDPASQGNAVMQDPLTGSLVVVPEALLNQSVFNPLATESQFMLDPRFWGMQASPEDPRWQQFYQQQKQMYEQYNHEVLAQHQERLSGYPFYSFYQKHFEAQKKSEEELATRLDQRPKSREEPSTKQRPERSDENSPKGKLTITISETTPSKQHEVRREDLDSESEPSNQRTSSSKPEKSEPNKIPNHEQDDPVVVREIMKSAQISEKRRESEEKLQQEEQNRQFQQYMRRDPVFNQPTRFPFPRIQPSISKPVYSPTEVSPRETRSIPPKPPHFAEANRAEVSPQVETAAATLVNMDIGTRFPFNQQPLKQTEEHHVLVAELQADYPARKVGASDKNVITVNVPNPRSSTSEAAVSRVKIDMHLPRKTTGEQSPKSEVNKVSPVDRHPRDGFDVRSLIRESSRPISAFPHTTSRRPSQNISPNSMASEPSRLLVAKAEKLPQDEELEVIRIDTPYEVPFHSREKKLISGQKAQEMDLLLSMSKEMNGIVESPSSKSEIIWTECSDAEEDYEVQEINDSVIPLKVEMYGHNKENSIMLSLQSSKSEEEKKIIREKIERLREIAKGRSREERFTTLTRQKELKSPSSIVNSVTASLNEVLDTNVMEKDIRMRLAELQKKYREKHRELARLQPRGKHGSDDHSGGKSTPVKRRPGRPRKRKYFGPSSKSDKTTPTLSTSNDATETVIKSDASSPTYPPSPGVKTLPSEDFPVFTESVEQPVQKKKKKTSVSKKEDVQSSLSSPVKFSPALVDTKIRPKQIKKSSSSKTKSTYPIPTMPPPETSNMEKLISAISPMFDDHSNQEPNQIESNTSTTNEPVIKQKPIKMPKKKKEKLSSTCTITTSKGSTSSDLASPDSVSQTSTKNNQVKFPKKSKKKAKTPSTPKVKTQFVFPESVKSDEHKKSTKKKDLDKQVEKETKQEHDGDLSDNDDVFTTGSGALDLLANFASSASFEKERASGTQSPFEGVALPKGIKRGRPKKSLSPTRESDATTLPKKKRKSKKLQNLGPKSPKKATATSERKGSVQKPHEHLQPIDHHPVLPPSPPVESMEVKQEQNPELLEEQLVKVFKEDISDHFVEAEREVTPPPEPIKEKRRKSRASIAKELDETRQAFALYGDWQPRRSERIFINSSVPSQSSADLSPLSSPTSKTSDFGWLKKAKKVGKGKKLKSDEASDAEPTEEESSVNTNKAVMKTKKKKCPIKGKKRRTSSTTDPDFVVRAPKRKAAKRDRSYEEFEDDEDDELVEEGEEIQDDDGEDNNDESQDNIDEDKSEPASGSVATQDIDDVLKTEEEDEKTVGSDSVNITADENSDRKSIRDESSSDTEEESKKEDFPTVKEESSGSKFNKSLADEKDEMKRLRSCTVAKSEGEKADEEKSEYISTATFAETTSSDETTVTERNHLPPEPVISFTKEELKFNTKMLLPVGRVFFRGRITFFQEPDLYGIVLPGERGRRPHLRSTEQLLSQAVKDIVPPAVEYLPVGTRVCAHWSPQYRCFYPGNVIETPPDEKSEVGKLWVEFDDGDSGIFPLSDLRKIITECPVQVDDVESDVVLPERRAHFLSSRGNSPSSRRPKDQEMLKKNKDDDTSGWESTEDAPVRRTRGKRRVKPRDRRFSEEATDSDAPCLSQDTDDEDTADQAEQGAKNESEENNVDVKMSSLQSKRTKRRTRMSRNDSKESDDNAIDDDKKNVKDKKMSKRLDDDTDEEEIVQDPGAIRSRPRSSRLSDRDLRKKSLTLNLNNSPRSRMAGSESPAQESTSQEEDSGSCSELFDESPQTENKTFQPRLGKRRRSALDKSKQEKAPGERWSWSGKNHQNKRKGKGRKVFYKTIVRGDEAISVGDCAVFTSNPSKSNNLPYVGKIESMWEGCSGNMVVKVKWFYHPEETKAGRRPSDAKHSLYRSTHVDENDVQTISHKCEVVSSEEYKRRTLDTIGTRSTTIDRSDRLFTCIGTYDPSTEKIDQ